VDFRVRKIHANSMQTADVIHNYRLDSPGDLSERVEDLRRLVAEEGSAELDAAVQEVSNEVGESEPRAGRLIAAVERVKLLAAGMGAAAEITSSAEQVIGAVRGLS
jgi:ABC-type transporter Mla subunit MlaD